ncbi:hypothetical protein OIO90_003920 [Microbotryomycetes sp. JL221]|nr:hypothetical protein OIO90_003920 [Microbotryomycetes sp. JL221]
MSIQDSNEFTKSKLPEDVIRNILDLCFLNQIWKITTLLNKHHDEKLKNQKRLKNLIQFFPCLNSCSKVCKHWKSLIQQIINKVTMIDCFDDDDDDDLFNEEFKSKLKNQRVLIVSTKSLNSNQERMHQLNRHNDVIQELVEVANRVQVLVLHFKATEDTLASPSIKFNKVSQNLRHLIIQGYQVSVAPSCNFNNQLDTLVLKHSPCFMHPNDNPGIQNMYEDSYDPALKDLITCRTYFRLFNQLNGTLVTDWNDLTCQGIRVGLGIYEQASNGNIHLQNSVKRCPFIVSKFKKWIIQPTFTYMMERKQIDSQQHNFDSKIYSYDVLSSGICNDLSDFILILNQVETIQIRDDGDSINSNNQNAMILQRFTMSKFLKSLQNELRFIKQDELQNLKVLEFVGSSIDYELAIKLSKTFIFERVREVKFLSA